MTVEKMNEVHILYMAAMVELLMINVFQAFNNVVISFILAVFLQTWANREF